MTMKRLLIKKIVWCVVMIRSLTWTCLIRLYKCIVIREFIKFFLVIMRVLVRVLFIMCVVLREKIGNFFMSQCYNSIF